MLRKKNVLAFSKITRLICGILYYGIARHLPVSTRPYAWGVKRFRSSIAKQLFDYAGKNVNIERGAYFGSGQGIRIDDNSGIGVNCLIGSPTQIGKYVMMGPDVVILTQNHCIDNTDTPMLFQGKTYPEKVVIEDDVWIGTRVIILPGVIVGKGAIVAAGAVLTKNVPPYAIVGGVPAKVLYYRKKEEILQ